MLFVRAIIVCTVTNGYFNYYIGIQLEITDF